MPRVPSIEVGQQFTNVKGQVASVVKYNSSLDVVIRFAEGGIQKKVNANQLRTGKFTDRKNSAKRVQKESTSLFEKAVDNG
jgi:hypothetical protein